MRLPDEIENAFLNGATILTASVRAARWLRREYALRQRREGRSVWATPPIEDWDSWLMRLWQTHSLAEAEAPLLLSSLQERRVWTQMQREDAAMLVSPESMAELAEEAYALLSAYEAHEERRRAWGKVDAEKFRQWAERFDRECARHGWISRAQVESYLATTPLALPERIVMTGFERITPMQRRLLESIANRGITLQICETARALQPPQLIRATDRREEIAACAAWIRELLDKNPETRIGVLAPDAGAIRGDVERIFRRVLMPETDNVFASTSAMPFEFSLGQPLAEVPVIRAALLMLRWIAAPLREEETSWLLLSGFLNAGANEYLALARFDASLRDSGTLSLEVSLPYVTKKMRGPHFASLEDLRVRLEDVLKTVAANRFDDELRLPSRWAELVQSLLRQAGWPGGQRTDAIEFQARARWERLLEEIALLDFDGQRTGYCDFLSILETEAANTIFAVESHGAPVQILGALEASGQQFDAMWFLGADDQSWPLRGRLHPLLPNDVQSGAGMPHASAEDDWELAESVMQRIAASAPLAVFSYAERNDDGEMRPSPLLAQVAPAMQWEQAQEPTAQHTANELEEIADDSGIIAWPLAQSAGGADVLANQAACPFRAFATKRLGAEPLNRSEWGLSAAERGRLLHAVLEGIWSPERGRLHSLKDLESVIAEGRLREIVEGAISEVFAQLMREHEDNAWMRAYLASEQRRLRVRLEAWLREEAKRVPFIVEASEKTLNDVSVSGLKLKLRADRIDKLADGKQLLIDYKTGVVSPADWKTMRPNEPQLPLYAVFGNVAEVCGVLFARIRADKTCFAGTVSDARTQLFADVSATSSLVKNSYTDAMREEWTAALLNLAEDFSRGEAQVDPKDGRKTCQHCPLPGLCRVAELSAQLEDESELQTGSGDE
jgi:ATP-dependent helicase/nuclease subunit B